MGKKGGRWQHCAQCNCRESADDRHKRGTIWLVSEASRTRTWRGIRETYKGQWISWYACDRCARRYRKREHLYWLIAAILFWLMTWRMTLHASDPTGAIAATILTIGSIVFLIKHLRTSAQDKEQYSRDKLLKKNIKNLLERDDFIFRYGALKLNPHARVQIFTTSEYRSGRIE